MYRGVSEVCVYRVVRVLYLYSCSQMRGVKKTGPWQFSPARQDAFFRSPGTLARRLKAATIHRRVIKIHHNDNLGFLLRACCPSRVSQISTSRWRSYPPQLPHRWTSSPEQPYWRFLLQSRHPVVRMRPSRRSPPSVHPFFQRSQLRSR